MQDERTEGPKLRVETVGVKIQYRPGRTALDSFRMHRSIESKRWSTSWHAGSSGSESFRTVGRLWSRVVRSLAKSSTVSNSSDGHVRRMTDNYSGRFNDVTSLDRSKYLARFAKRRQPAIFVDDEIDDEKEPPRGGTEVSSTAGFIY